MNKELREFLDEHAAHQAFLLSELRDTFTKNSQPVLGALALPVGEADRAKTVLANSAGRCVGWAIKETTGNTPAELDLKDGTNTDGDLLFPIALSPGESNREWFGPSGISFGVGLFASITGAITGTVWIGAIDL